MNVEVIIPGSELGELICGERGRRCPYATAGFIFSH